MPIKNTMSESSYDSSETDDSVHSVEDENSVSSFDDESTERSFTDEDVTSDYQSGGEYDDDDDHLDRDPDDELESDDGENQEDTDEEFDPVEHEELAEEDEEEEQEEYTEGGEEDDVEFDKDSRVCYASYIKNKDGGLILDDNDSEIYAQMPKIRIDDADRITDPEMTSYEITKILGIRTKQLTLCSQPLITGVDKLDPPQIAYLELCYKKNPFIIVRKLPEKKYEEWKTEEMDLIRLRLIKDEYFVPKGFNLSKLKLD